MKSALVVTLIICGTIIIALPPASDFLYNQTVAKIMLERQGATSVTLPAQMGDKYRLGCWLLGTATIASAILLSRSHPLPTHVRTQALATS